MWKIPVWENGKWKEESAVTVFGQEKSLTDWLKHPCCQATREMFRKRMSRTGDPIISLFWRGCRPSPRFTNPWVPPDGYKPKTSVALWYRSRRFWQPIYKYGGIGISINLMPSSTEERALEVVDMVNLTVRGIETPLIYPSRIPMYLDLVGDYNPTFRAECRSMRAAKVEDFDLSLDTAVL